MKPHPLHVGVADLRRRWGSRRPVVVEAVLDGLELSSSRVPAGAPVRVDLVLESLPESVVASGTVEAPWVGECRRCLREVTGRLSTEVREVFEGAPVEGETYPLLDDHIDLEPLVRDAVMLELPLAPLCEDGCRGPVPDEFPVVEAEEVAEPEPPADPRWQALQQLHFD